MRDRNIPNEASGCRPKGCARIPTMGVVGCAASRGGQYDKDLAVNHPGRESEVAGSNLYQAEVVILREGGYYSTGRKFNSRRTAEAECGSTTGHENEEWRTVRIDDWFLELKVGIPPHRHLGSLRPMVINREQEGMAKLRIGTYGYHSAINITRATSDEKWEI